MKFLVRQHYFHAESDLKSLCGAENVTLLATPKWPRKGHWLIDVTDLTKYYMLVLGAFLEFGHQEFKVPQTLNNYQFTFKGGNMQYGWWHFSNPECPLFNLRFTMAERQGCEICGFTPAECRRSLAPANTRVAFKAGHSKPIRVSEWDQADRAGRLGELIKQHAYVVEKF
jgi:hypothetical protein